MGVCSSACDFQKEGRTWNEHSLGFERLYLWHLRRYCKKLQLILFPIPSRFFWRWCYFRILKYAEVMIDYIRTKSFCDRKFSSFGQRIFRTIVSLDIFIILVSIVYVSKQNLVRNIMLLSQANRPKHARLTIVCFIACVNRVKKTRYRH